MICLLINYLIIARPETSKTNSILSNQSYLMINNLGEYFVQIVENPYIVTYLRLFFQSC